MSAPRTWTARRLLPVLAAALLVLATGGPSTRAQSDRDMMYDPTMDRGSLTRLFRVLRDGAPERAPRRPVVPSQQVRRPVVVRPSPILPKIAPSIFVTVIGDSLADLLAGGIDEVLGDVQHAAVVRRIRAASGLVRADVQDWPAAIRDLLASGDRVTVGVVLLGANDRQPLREGEITHEPLSERWSELYRARIEAIAQAFQASKVPLIWVGAPPMQNPRLSLDLVAINEMARQGVERAGGTFVDLWPAFVDSENRFAASGPNLDGQIVRLRTQDGVHFTAAGARKAAHFVDIVLRRLLPDLRNAPQPLPPPPADLAGWIAPTAIGAEAIPLPPELQPGAIERQIDRIARDSLGFEPLAPPVIQVKPVAGPVLPLNGPALAADGRLVTSSSYGQNAELRRELDRVYGEGMAPRAVPGRADDFRWPRN